jgi:hypothetical protein
VTRSRNLDLCIWVEVRDITGRILVMIGVYGGHGKIEMGKVL